jgi:hypothetical protein
VISHRLLVVSQLVVLLLDGGLLLDGAGLLLAGRLSHVLQCTTCCLLSFRPGMTDRNFSSTFSTGGVVFPTWFATANDLSTLACRCTTC